MIYLHFYKLHNDQTWQDSTKGYPYLAGDNDVIRTRYVASIYGFISTTTNPRKTGLGRMVYQHILNLLASMMMSLKFMTFSPLF